MPIRVAINGFGRIGRNTFKASFGRLPELEFVAVNDLTETKVLAHLLKHDTSYKGYAHDITYDEQHIIVDGKKIRVYAEKDPTKLPWAAEKIDVVLECTGRFTDEAGAGQHITAGAKRVIISAPAKGGIPTHVLGVNPEGAGKPAIINNASCTTNCIAPVAAIMHETFGVAKALMTTTHSYTAEQNLVDGPPPGGKSGDLRRARAAAANIIPTSTGAAIAVTEVIPELKGLFDGMALRVPTPTVSITDFTFLLKRKTTVEEINDVFRKAAESPRWKGILGATDEPLVSSDYVGDTRSSIVDLPLTKVVDGDFVKVVAWYDNEWGYSCRLGEMAALVGKSL